jgi:hypothetical protein
MREQKLSIPKPCPFQPTEANRIGDGHYCKSCEKVVVDFRGMSLEEVKAHLRPKMCGIFDESHVTQSYFLSFWQHKRFQILSVLSLLGFSVNPLVAQQVKTNSDASISIIELPLKADTLKSADGSIKQCETNPSQTTFRRKKPSKSFPAIFRKKQKFRPLGCPEF